MSGLEAGLLFVPAEFLPEPDTDLGVQRGQGLVEQQHLGLDGQRPRQGHPLLLAAGHLVGVSLGLSLQRPSDTPTRCPAASSSGWPWRGRWPSSPRCCCSTSPCPRWTPRSVSGSGRNSAGTKRSPASRPLIRSRSSRAKDVSGPG